MNIRQLFSRPKLENDQAINAFDGKLFEVNNWVVSKFILKQLVPIVGIKPFPLPELQLLTAATIYFKPTHIFDWGTHVGKAARIFWEIKKAFMIPFVQYSIDLPDTVDHPEHPHKLRGKMIKKMPEINQLDGDGVTEALRVYKQLNDSNPLFFLDGDHEYKTVKRELHQLHKYVKKPVIIVHDTFFQTKKSHYNVGPHRAIVEFIQKEPNTYQVIELNLGLPGMTLLYPKG